MKKDSRKLFDIPWWAIVLSLMFSPLLGVVLILLNLVSGPSQQKVTERADPAGHASGGKSGEKNSAPNTGADVHNSSADCSSQPHGGTKRRSRGASEVISLILSIVMFGIGMISAVMIAVDAEWHLTVSSLIRLLMPFALSGGIFLISKALGRRRGRRNAYRALIGDNEAFDLKEIASATSLSLGRVRRDLQRMVDSGEFGENAYIDRRLDVLFCSPDAAEVYLQHKNTDAAAENVGDGGECGEFLLEIRRLDEEINDEAVSAQIRYIEEYTRHIFNYVSEHPDKKKTIRTFMNYYLPTTLKLLSSYAKIERVGVAGENMKRSKENIESTLEMLAEAFKYEVDILFKSESLDISSDIDVLETMLKKDGMTSEETAGVLGNVAAARGETDGV